MTRLRLEIELEYDADLMHGDSAEDRAWFERHILMESDDLLILHSNEIGDEIGTVKVTRIIET